MIERLSDFESGRQAVKLICDASNGGRSSDISNGILESLRHEHRTLQQDFWRAIQGAAIGYSEFSHDLRNESAVEMCKKIKGLDRGLPRF